MDYLPGLDAVEVWDVWRGDAEDILCNYDDNSFDAIITDPPYSYNFMGNSWDNLGRGFQAWNASWAAEALNVLKPGAYALVFGGTRTYHRLVCGLEDAGFEIRDTIMWVYGNGMPKHKSCLKPGYEPIVVARKPAKKATPFPGLETCSIANGRWPANLVLDEQAAAELDAQSGYSQSRKTAKSWRKGGRATNFAMRTSGRSYEDQGGASRYFPVFLYHPRATRAERPVVVFDHIHQDDGSVEGCPGCFPGEITHPTVKPLNLIRWLARLVTPDRGRILDPFAGSGTTAEACELEGFDSVLIEQDPNYIRLIEKRMSKYTPEVAA